MREAMGNNALQAFVKIESREIRRKECGDERSRFPGFSIAHMMAVRNGYGYQPAERQLLKKSLTWPLMCGQALVIAPSGTLSAPAAVFLAPLNALSISSSVIGSQRSVLVPRAGGGRSKSAQLSGRWVARSNAIFSSDDVALLPSAVSRGGEQNWPVDCAQRVILKRPCRWLLS